MQGGARGRRRRRRSLEKLVVFWAMAREGKRRGREQEKLGSAGKMKLHGQGQRPWMGWDAHGHAPWPAWWPYSSMGSDLLSNLL
jgi:hypothetical protein